MMGIDNDLTVILREFVQFLESLRDVKLPTALENVRENLLARSKATLTAFGSRASSCSPEPYLDMNAGKGILIATNKPEELEEYVGAEQCKPNQDYYETFQDFRELHKNTGSSLQENDETSNNLIEIYANFSVTQTRTKCHKCGPLHKKERFLVFEPLRSYWVGLVGSHLLIYSSEKDSRPVSVISIRGYKSRHAPSIVPRNQKRGEAAFEIYRPGYETLQFVARSPEEMEQWVLVICQLDNYETDKKRENETFLEILNTDSKLESKGNLVDERYQDVGALKSKENTPTHSQDSPKSLKDVKNNNNSDQSPEKKNKNVEVAPPLPARTPRKLPKLPEEANTAPSYEHMEVYDEDDIYHRIEDVRNVGYQNCTIAKETKNENRNENYDDVETITENLRTQKEKESGNNEKNEDVKQIEMYDDINSVILKVQENGIVSYDEVKATEEKKEKSGKSKCSKAQYKKSFLDRVRKRRNLVSKKEEKVSESSENDEVEIHSEYHCPPPPRPIYVKPPTLKNCLNVEQFYDDIDTCQKDGKSDTEKQEKMACKNDENQTTEKSKTIPETFENAEYAHYQVPKPTPHRRSVSQSEDLYDDIALLTDFKARQRDSLASVSEKRVWSRFSSGKKRMFDFSGSPSTVESEDSFAKITTFQRLMNKVENSLEKSPKSSVSKSQSSSVT